MWAGLLRAPAVAVPTPLAVAEKEGASCARLLEAMLLGVEVRTMGGRSLSCRVDHAKGTMENPLTPGEVHTKYLSLATTVTSAAHAEQIPEIVRQIDRMPDIGLFAGLLRSLKLAGSSAKRRAKTGTS